MSTYRDTDLVSVIVPMYGNESTLRELLERLAKSMARHETEIVAVDDASADGSAVSVRLAAEEQGLPCTVVHHERNRGQHASILSGLHRARGSICVVMDADLQDPPEVVPDLVREIKSTSATVVFGDRRTADGGRYDPLSVRLFKIILFRIVGARVPADIGTFFAIDSAARESLIQLSHEEPYLITSLFHMRLPTHFVSYVRAAPVPKLSGYTVTTRIVLGFRAIRFALRLRMRRSETNSALSGSGKTR